MNRLFKIVFGMMLLCLILCVAQLIRIEFGYDMLSLLNERNIMTLNPQQVAKQYILALKKKITDWLMSISRLNQKKYFRLLILLY